VRELERGLDLVVGQLKHLKDAGLGQAHPLLEDGYTGMVKDGGHVGTL
jgi:hypothetical protein